MRVAEIPGLCCLLLCLLSSQAVSAPDADLGEALAAHSAMAVPPLLERTGFLLRDPVAAVRLSPDGNYLGYIVSEGRQKNLYLLNTSTREKKFLLNSMKLTDLNWSDDSQLLYLEFSDAIGYLPLTGDGQPAYIVAADYAKGGTFLGPDHSRNHGIFVSYHDDADSYRLEHYDLDGQHDSILQTTGELISGARYSPDRQRLFVRMETAHGFDFHLYENGQDKLIHACSLASDPNTCRLISYDEETASLWLSGNGNDNFARLLRYDVQADATEVVDADPDGVTDLFGWTLSGARPVIASYANGLLENTALDADARAVLAALGEQLPSADLVLNRGSNDTWLVAETSADLRFHLYFLFDSTSRRLSPILDEERTSMPKLPREYLSRKIPISYTASDGMLIYGYLSLPKGKALSETPLLAMPHPGPIGRVASDYNPDTQFLVNRGYIVFEPNFRISTGYGIDYVLSARRDYDLVQQDILDGIAYLLDQGIGDRTRVGITGYSFGGYTVLKGLADRPDMFKAGFAKAGLADQGAVMSARAKLMNPAAESPMSGPMTKLMIADIDDPDEMERLSRQSPFARLEAITAPLVLMHGGRDTSVPISHIRELSLALVNHGKRLSLLIDDDLGHGNWPLLESSAYFYLMETFFARYLGGRKQTLDDERLRAYIRTHMAINTNPDFSWGEP